MAGSSTTNRRGQSRRSWALLAAVMAALLAGYGVYASLLNVTGQAGTGLQTGTDDSASVPDHARTPLWFVIEFSRKASAIKLVGKRRVEDCVICCLRASDSVLSPCGHKSLCYDCARSVQGRKCGSNGLCPFCRAPIRQVNRSLIRLV